MSRQSLSRAMAALVGLAVLGAVLFGALFTVLLEVGVPQWAASPAAIGATIAAVLAVADTYTPLGDSERRAALERLPRQKIGADLALAAVVGGVFGLLGAYVLLSGDGGGLARLVVLSTAVVLGYGAFVTRNLAVYRGDAR